MNWITQGDANTGYFYNYANGRRRKNFIFSLDHEGISIKGKDELRNHIYSFWKDLFGSKVSEEVRFSNEIWSIKHSVKSR